MALSYMAIATARVHSVHLMNTDSALQIKPSDVGCSESTCWLLPSTFNIAIYLL